MYELTYDKKDNILFVDGQGEIDFDQIIRHIRSLDEYLKYSKELFILEDSRSMKLTIELDQVPLIADEFKKLVTKYNLVRHADIQTYPSNVAYAMVYQFKAKAPNYNYEIFSSLESATNWLLQEMD